MSEQTLGEELIEAMEEAVEYGRGASKLRERTVPGRALGSLPEGWRMVRFGDVVRNVDVYVSDPLEAGLERYIGLDHLDPESLHIKRWGLIADGTSFTRKFTEGQVLFGKRRAYQRKAAVADFDGICSGDILVFEPKGDDLLPDLLPFIVQSEGFYNHALGTSAGSLSPRTRWRDLAEYEFPLPPKDEQRRIADILWAADDVVNRYYEVLGTLNSLGETLSAAAFEGTGSEVEHKSCAVVFQTRDTEGRQQPALYSFDKADSLVPRTYRSWHRVAVVDYGLNIEG